MALDEFKGLIMVLMAIDHTSFFVARTHWSEFWGVPLPDYDGDGAVFLTRLVTHLCAPGFFFAMGAGMRLLAARRAALGWSRLRTTRYFASRGIVLILIQQLVENPAWLIGLVSLAPDAIHGSGLRPGSGGQVFVHLGVLFALGAAMVVAGAGHSLPGWVQASVGGTLILGAQLLVPAADASAVPFAAALRIAAVPGQSGILNVLYPVFPWLGVTLLGLGFGDLLGRNPARAWRVAAVAGAAALVVFVALRLGGGFGNLHPLRAGGWIAFLTVTKYPPSLAFLCLTLGANLAILAALARFGSGLLTVPLTVFGRSALFFYLAHLYVYALIGLFFRHGTTLPVMYATWLLGLALLWPLCNIYGRFKQTKDADSLWRLF